MGGGGDAPGAGAVAGVAAGAGADAEDGAGPGAETLTKVGLLVTGTPGVWGVGAAATGTT